MWFALIVGVGVLIGLGLAFCGRPSPGPPPPAPSPGVSPSAGPSPVPSPDPAAEAAGVWTPPEAGKKDGCSYARAADGALLPDRGCTTGATNPGLPLATLCAPGFRTGPYRNVSQAAKDVVYASYGLAKDVGATHEIDHLVPIEIGGANDRANLWPQPERPTPGYHEKDLVENLLRRQVCDGSIALSVAQREIATDWTRFLPAARAAGLGPKPHVGDEEAD